jgi:hypothetical protein
MLNSRIENPQYQLSGIDATFIGSSGDGEMRE